ncbi:MAG: YchE family NAAT transporter [Gammaproteobacteria bacterium]|nr:YchE family NAAT transporter [Gammaproteobacteria bacterium]
MMALADVWAEYLKFFVGLIAILNPIGVIPIFINLTHGYSVEERNHTAKLTGLSVGAVMLVGLIAGEYILNVFGISIASFRVGGGILILLMAISMMNATVSPARQTSEEAREAVLKENVAVVPLAIPLIAGPGAISTVIVYANRAAEYSHQLILGGGIIVVALLVWLIFRMAQPLANRLGRTGINVVTRIMGLIMAAIGVEFMANGLKGLFPVLAG